MRRDQATEEEAGGGRPTKKVGWEPRPDSSMAGASLPCTAEGWVLQPREHLGPAFPKHSGPATVDALPEMGWALCAFWVHGCIPFSKEKTQSLPSLGLTVHWARLTR